MKFQTLGAVGDPVYIAPNPINPASPLPSPAPLPAGATVDVGTVNAGAWSAEKFAALVGQASDIASKVGGSGLLGPALSRVDWRSTFTRVASFAAAGALAGGVGAVVGAILGMIVAVAGMWGRLQNPNWYSVGPGVHDWATRYAPEAFIAQAQAEGTNTWPDVYSLTKHLLAWWMGTQGVVLTGQNNRHYNNGLDSLYLYELQLRDPEGPAKFYLEAGVDWYGTRTARAEAGDFAANRNVNMYVVKVALPDGSFPDGAGDGGIEPPSGQTVALVGAGLLVAYLVAKGS